MVWLSEQWLKGAGNKVYENRSMERVPSKVRFMCKDVICNGGNLTNNEVMDYSKMVLGAHIITLLYITIKIKFR